MIYCKDPNNHVHFLFNPALLPKDCTIISWQEVQELQNPPTLEQVKLDKLQEIENKRDAQCIKNVQAHSRTWQADNRSQNLLNAAINLTQAGLPLPSVWRDADNNNMLISSLSDLLAIASAMAVQTQTAYAESWVKKQQVINAATIQELKNIVA